MQLKLREQLSKNTYQKKKKKSMNALLTDIGKIKQLPNIDFQNSENIINRL